MLFYEFGYVLYNILLDVSWFLILGMVVVCDFVELFSQFFEYWLEQFEVLDCYVCYVEIGVLLFVDLCDRIIVVGNVDQGFVIVEYLESVLVDLVFYCGMLFVDFMVWQVEVLVELGVFVVIFMCYVMLYFVYVFLGDGYSVGYYSYMWFEVMDVDVFDVFLEKGSVFDFEIVEKLQEWILFKGDFLFVDEFWLKFRE